MQYDSSFLIHQSLFGHAELQYLTDHHQITKSIVVLSIKEKKTNCGMRDIEPNTHKITKFGIHDIPQERL